MHYSVTGMHTGKQHSTYWYWKNWLTTAVTSIDSTKDSWERAWPPLQHISYSRIALLRPKGSKVVWQHLTSSDLLSALRPRSDTTLHLFSAKPALFLLPFPTSSLSSLLLPSLYSQLDQSLVLVQVYPLTLVPSFALPSRPGLWAPSTLLAPIGRPLRLRTALARELFTRLWGIRWPYWPLMASRLHLL